MNYKNENIETNIEKINQNNAKYIYSQYGESYDINQYAEYDIYTNLDIEKISQTEKIPMSFIVGRLAKKKLITYRSRLYQDNYQK
mgnify:CR=1 FL=1